MTKNISLAGIFPPIPTPFDAAGELDLKALAANLEKWGQYPLAGYVVLGSNGEFPYLSDAEKLTYLEAARKHNETREKLCPAFSTSLPTLTIPKSL